MKKTKKSAKELIQMLEDLQREASMPIVCSQTSVVSDSWFIDNNPLMAACEGNADFDWKYNSDELECKTIKKDDNFEDLYARDSAFSSVAPSPITSSNEKQSNDANKATELNKMEAVDYDADVKADEGNHCSSIINDVFEPFSQEAHINEQRRREEIEQWLLMVNSSQGNEYLSSQESVANETKGVQPEATNSVVEIAEPKSSDVIEPEVSQIQVLSAAGENEFPVVESRLRRKRTLDYSEVHSPSSEPKPKRKSPSNSDKKKDQNKEAAKRYRDRKKKESADFKLQFEKLENINRESRSKIKDMLKSRKVYIDMFKSLDAEKTNPNFKIVFPSWMK